MQKFFALGALTLLLIAVGFLLLGISFGIVFQIPNFDRFAPNVIFFVIGACLSLFEGIRRAYFSKAKNETSVRIPKGASPAVVEAIRALDSNNSRERKNGIESLGQLSDPTAREALVYAVKHPYKDVRFEAGFKLAEFRDDRGTPAIIEALYDDDMLGAGIKALDALTHLGVHVITNFIKALDHENPEIRFQAARTLGQAGFSSDNESVPRLMRSLKDTDPRVRSAAARSLAEIGDNRALPALVDAINSEKDQNILEVTITSLSVLDDGNNVPLLISVLERSNKTTGLIIKTVSALQRIHTEEALKVANQYRGSHYWEDGISPNRQWQRKQQQP